MKSSTRLSKRQIKILAGLFFLFVATMGSGLGFLIYGVYERPAASSMGTFTYAPSKTDLLSTNTVLQTATFTLIATPLPVVSPSLTTTPLPVVGLTPTETTYIVQVNDTLWSIAVQFSTTVEAIKKANNLTSDLIYPGQQLFILLPSSPRQLWR